MTVRHARFQTTPDYSLCATPLFAKVGSVDVIDFPNRFYPPLTTKMLRDALDFVTCKYCYEIIRKEVMSQ
jgi:hypothetical protein